MCPHLFHCILIKLLQFTGDPARESHFIRLWNGLVRDNGLQKVGNIRSIAGDQEWIDSTHRMLIRQCWRDLLSIVLSKKHVILKGKAGRGKSIFILFAIFEILHCAKHGKPSDLLPAAKPFPTDPHIVYIDRSGVRYLATVNNVTILTGDGWPVGTHYCFSDNNDISDAKIGSLLTMAVTSGDTTVLKEFSKRMDAIDRRVKAILYMPSLELEEMQQLFPSLTPEELQFKFNIVGGNPRKIEVDEEEVADHPFSGVVESSVLWMFGQEYVPSEAAIQSPKQILGKWAINTVVAALELALQEAANSAPKTDSSFFMDYYVFKNFRARKEVFSSFFLGLVAGKLQEGFEATVIGNLQRLFGASGLGNAFEFTAHAQLSETSEKHWCRSSTGEYKQLAP